jgi:hypothetical protein
MNITFIGNCQTVSLSFYFQQLLNQNNNISWCLYGEEWKTHLGKWTDKCKNKIIDYTESIQKIKNSDIIIYQEINVNKSLFCNTKTLHEIKKSSCKLIQIPSIYLDYDDFDNSIKELISRENLNNVNIKVSDVLYKFKDNNLVVNRNHPKTFLFMEIIKLLCNLLNLPFFTEQEYNKFLQNENYMELP